MKSAGFHRVLVRGVIAKNEGCGTVHVKDVPEVLRMSAEFGGKLISCTCGAENRFVQSSFPSVSVKYIQTCYEEVSRVVIASRGSSDVWIENGDCNQESFLGFIQLLFDKTATILKSTALAIPPNVSAILPNVSVRKTKWLVGIKHTLVRFPPVCCTQNSWNKMHAL